MPAPRRAVRAARLDDAPLQFARLRDRVQFWGLARTTPPDREAEVVLELRGGGSERHPYRGPVPVAPPEGALAEPGWPAGGGGEPPVAVCMATYEPDPDLFRAQVDSLRAQSHPNWLCLISDDRSSPGGRATIEEVVGGDERFRVAFGERRLGFYGNYERALAMVPAEAAFVGLADQDDRWRPEKLATLVAEIGAANLAYSDARIVRPDGSVRAGTYWTHRRNAYDDLASLLFANTVSGSAALFRRDLLDFALPFPIPHGRFFHDHWLACCALALGRITYVDEPLYDYVQHRRAALGHDRAHVWAARGRGRGERARHFLGDPRYFYGHWRDTYFLEYWRVRLFAEVIATRGEGRLGEGRRAVIERLRRDEFAAPHVAWLAARTARGLTGRDETLGAEGRILRAFAWRYLLGIRSRTRLGTRWLPDDASLP